ncbi:hypothetical protein [Streptomyces sp. CRN 30]|uniref:hypothetical protein n=1 Tax=Streptomyces sp. CRN 30 TaxID=3075613 RepID=UPI002A7F938A|nr:hypothetical protein [Streptomyces sp. CRN 30]
MEQRIGSSNQPLDAASVNAASVNPAFIPGLTSPVSAGPEKAEEDEKTTEAEAATVPEETATTSEESAEQDADETPEETPDEGEETPDGPVFEAADRRAEIVADHSGVRLRLDDQSCEFRWDEIGAVETETSRFGRRFTVTVHTSDRRWYPIEIEATSRSRFAEWDARLDEVLDAYFEDGDEAEGADKADEDSKES